MDPNVHSRIVINAENLTKRYRDLVAVDGISFAIGQGEVFGFLGPNGAGKTSTMKMISCVSPVTDGKLTVDGMDVNREQRDIKSLLGIVSQADSLDPGLNVIQNLLAFARYHNLDRDTARRRAWEALDLFQLRDKAHNSVDELSGGMRRRLLIGRSLLHDPTILVLDEPTTGLDPQSRLLVWEKLIDLRSRGITILLTTHYMEEASYLCDRLLVMDSGRILAEGNPRKLIEVHVGREVTEIRVRQREKAELTDRLRSSGRPFEDWGDSVLLYADNGVGPLEDVGLDGYEVLRRPGNLEDVFLRLTGRGLREE